jgi:hypothetical protein
LAWTLVACAATPPAKLQAQEKRRAFPQPFSEVWSAVVDVIATLGFSLEAMEKESGLITTSPGQISIEYVNCGSSLFTVTTEARGKLNLYVKAETDLSTVVQINTFFEGLNQGIGEYWLRCESNGKLESELFSLVESLL